MSEPVSNAEIEDVLSSIRRLVSENSGPSRQAEEKDAAAEKLVLTPAFRVDESSAPSGDDDADDANSASAESEASPESGPDDVAPKNEGEALVLTEEHMSADDAQADAASETAANEPAKDPHDTAADLRADSDHAPEPGADTATPQSALEQRIAELEAVISRSSAEFEPDGSEAADLPEAAVLVHPAAVLDGSDWGEDIEQADPADPADEPLASDMPSENLAPEPETGAPAVDDRGESEADASESEGDAAAWEVVEQEDDTAAFDEESDEALIDEDALREMVSRMVRDELQGTVGERITQNVRRMVRREIARALALQNID